MSAETPIDSKAAGKPVVIVNTEPVAVVAVDPVTSIPVPVEQLPLPPTTTAQHDLVTADQRRINRIWEVTQAIIAVVVTIGTLAISAMLVLRENKESATAFLLLSNAFFMIVTSYFQRTNHTNMGGIPPENNKDHR